MEKIKRTLSRKHLLIVGGTEIKRKKFINELVQFSNYETYRFPSKLKTLYEYLDYVQKENLYITSYNQKGKYGTNQLLDFHWDWMQRNNSLMILEEFQYMEEEWKIELIRVFTQKIENHKKGEVFTHLIVSQEKEDSIIDKLVEKVSVSEKENRTKRQIIEGSLRVIDLDF